MRLNFSSSEEDELREGIRRIGSVVSEQVALYETITREHRAEPEEGDEPGGDVVPLPKRS
jgi:2-aminoadipate transaminase